MQARLLAPTDVVGIQLKIKILADLPEIIIASKKEALQEIPFSVTAIQEMMKPEYVHTANDHYHWSLLKAFFDAHADEQIRMLGVTKEAFTLLFSKLVWWCIIQGEFALIDPIIMALPSKTLDGNYSETPMLKDLLKLNTLATIPSTKQSTLLKKEFESEEQDKAEMGFTLDMENPTLLHEFVYLFTKAKGMVKSILTDVLKKYHVKPDDLIRTFINYKDKPDGHPKRASERLRAGISRKLKQNAMNIERLVDLARDKRWGTLKTYFDEWRGELESSVQYTELKTITSQIAEFISRANTARQFSLIKDIALSARLETIDLKYPVVLDPGTDNEHTVSFLYYIVSLDLSEEYDPTSKLINCAKQDSIDLNEKPTTSIDKGVSIAWQLLYQHSMRIKEDAGNGFRMILFRELVKYCPHLVDLEAKPEDPDHEMVGKTVAEVGAINDDDMMLTYIAREHFPNVKRLLAKGVNVTVPEGQVRNDFTPIQAAVASTSGKMLEYLIEQGGDIYANFPLKKQVSSKQGVIEWLDYPSILHMIAEFRGLSTDLAMDRVLKRIMPACAARYLPHAKDRLQLLIHAGNNGHVLLSKAILMIMDTIEACEAAKRIIKVTKYQDIIFALIDARIARLKEPVGQPEKSKTTSDNAEKVVSEEDQLRQAVAILVMLTDISATVNIQKQPMLEFIGSKEKVRKLVDIIKSHCQPQQNKGKRTQRKIQGSEDINATQARFVLSDSSLKYLINICKNDAVLSDVSRLLRSETGHQKLTPTLGIVEDDLRPVFPVALSPEAQTAWREQLLAAFCHAQEVHIAWHAESKQFFIHWEDSLFWKMRAFEASYKQLTTVEMSDDALDFVFSQLNRHFAKPRLIGLTRSDNPAEFVVTPYDSISPNMSVIEQAVSKLLLDPIVKLHEERVAPELVNNATTQAQTTSPALNPTTSADITMLEQTRHFFATIAGTLNRPFNFIIQDPDTHKVCNNKWWFCYNPIQVHTLDKLNSIEFMKLIVASINSVRQDSIGLHERKNHKHTVMKVILVIKMTQEEMKTLQEQMVEIQREFNKLYGEKRGLVHDTTSTEKPAIFLLPSIKNHSIFTPVIDPAPLLPEPKKTTGLHLINAIRDMSDARRRNLAYHLNALIHIPEPQEGIIVNRMVYYNAYALHALRLFMLIADAIPNRKTIFHNWRNVIRHELNQLRWKTLHDATHEFVESMKQVLHGIKPDRTLGLQLPDLISAQALQKLETALEPFREKIAAGTLGIEKSYTPKQLKQFSRIAQSVLDCIADSERSPDEHFNASWYRDAKLMVTALKQSFSRNSLKRETYQQLGHEGFEEPFEDFANNLLTAPIRCVFRI